MAITAVTHTPESPSCLHAHDLPTEMWLMIASEVSTCYALASLATSCCRLYDALFPQLMREAASFLLLPYPTTVLHWASEWGYIRVVRGVLESGASVDAFDPFCHTPLMRACEFGHEDVVECLIVHGADPDFISKGETAFTKAVCFNHPGVMSVMFCLGTTVHYQHWWTLLQAASEGHVDVARLLLENGVDANFQLTTQDKIPQFANPYVGQTAVYLAVIGQHAEMVELLVDSGADINGVDGDKALQHLAFKWPYLSPGEEMCLYELHGRRRRQTIWWKLCQVAKGIGGALAIIFGFVICLMPVFLWFSTLTFWPHSTLNSPPFPLKPSQTYLHCKP